MVYIMAGGNSMGDVKSQKPRAGECKRMRSGGYAHRSQARKRNTQCPDPSGPIREEGAWGGKENARTQPNVISVKSTGSLWFMGGYGSPGDRFV